MAIHDLPEISSLNEDARRFNNRRSGISVQTVVRTLGHLSLIIGLIVLALYVLTDKLSRNTCNEDDGNVVPLNERNGILELSWDSLPSAIRTLSNLIIIEHNGKCGPLNLTTLQPLTCGQLTLGYMPHSTFSFRHTYTDGRQSSQLQDPCYAIRWIVNRLDTYHGPFIDMRDLKEWFNNVTSHEYNGCLGKPGVRLNDKTSSIQKQN